MVLLCRGTTPCLAFENTNVRKQRALPFWCINYKISWKIVDRFCLFWKQVNLLKLLTVAENQGGMNYTETEVWLNCNFHSTSALPLEKHYRISEEHSFGFFFFTKTLVLINFLDWRGENINWSCSYAPLKQEVCEWVVPVYLKCLLVFFPNSLQQKHSPRKYFETFL